MTIREMIAKLEELAAQHGDDIKVVMYDEYTAEEGWDYKEEDLWVPVDCCFDKQNNAIEIFMDESCDEEEEEED